ncbi:MAG: response regulator transcription factor [Flavobacteriales bacterium]|nr:response regulator transcription factor [Flavobacteriales bacterium]
MESHQVSIAIADDHLLFTQSLAGLLFSNPTYQPCFLVETVEDLKNAITRQQPDLLILDIHLPPRNSLELLPELRSIAPDTKILILTMHQPEEFGITIQNFEGHGYLLKTSGKETLEAAIESLCLRKDKFFSPEIKWAEANKTLSKSPLPLTRREKEIIEKIKEGKTTKQIADELHLSEHTVKTHRTKIREKLEVSGVGNLLNRIKNIIN